GHAPFHHALLEDRQLFADADLAPVAGDFMDDPTNNWAAKDQRNGDKPGHVGPEMLRHATPSPTDDDIISYSLAVGDSWTAVAKKRRSPSRRVTATRSR